MPTVELYRSLDLSLPIPSTLGRCSKVTHATTLPHHAWANSLKTQFLSTLLLPKGVPEREKHGRSLIHSKYCVASDSTNRRPPSSLSTAPNHPFWYNLRSMLTTQRQFNCYVNMIFYALVTSSSLVADVRKKSILRHHREVGWVYRDSEVCEGQY